MDRYEVPIDAHLAPLVEAAERGDEVVIMREGRGAAALHAAVASPVDQPKHRPIDAIRQYWRETADIPPMEGSALDLVRTMRAMDDH